MPRLISLAAGCVPDATPDDVLRTAAAAGYGATGLRLPPELEPAAVGRLKALADDLGLPVLDVEVARLGPGTPLDEHLRLLDVAQRLGARHLIAVSRHAEAAAFGDELTRLCAAAAGGPTCIALEFLPYSCVDSLPRATGLAADAGAVLLLDALHLARSGTRPADLADVPPDLLGYLQVCDAPAAAPAALQEEARHHRLPPGTGELPLRAMLAHLPGDLTLSVEVQSDDLVASTPPLPRAVGLLAALDAVLG